MVRTDRDEEHYKDDDSPYLKQLSDVLITYLWYNWDLGYVQGMNDLLAIIIPIMADESDSFWCFAGIIFVY